MQILNSAEAGILADLLLEDLPWSILDMICQSPGISEGGLTGAVTKQLPSTIDVEQIRNRCISSIRWFLQNGDITTSGNRRYLAVPPYVAFLQNRNDPQVRLHGGFRNDEQIRSAIRACEGDMEVSLVPWYWQATSKGNAPNVGLLRRIVFAVGREESIIQSLRDLGIPTVNSEHIANQLPSIRTLLSLPQTAYRSMGPNWGLWNTYDPARKAYDRWNELSNRGEARAGLLKWGPSQDWRGEQAARYFLCNSMGELAELSRSFARLWMYYFDSVEDNVRSIWVDGDVIWVPLELPEPHQHWLHLLSEAWYRDGAFRKYYLTTEPRDVSSILQETLGLRSISSRPEKNFGG